jgi:hypothetical protein
MKVYTITESQTLSLNFYKSNETNILNVWIKSMIESNSYQKWD